MRRAVGAVLSVLLACVVSSAQNQQSLYVCDLENNCYPIDTSVMGGIRFEDYRVTNPAAVQFDPAQRLKELAALGPSTAATFCAAPPVFTTPAPAITFDTNNVQAQIYYTPATPASLAPLEFMDVHFTNFTASNGYTSPNFDFRMVRPIPDGLAVAQFQIQLQVGNPGLSAFHSAAALSKTVTAPAIVRTR